MHEWPYLGKGEKHMKNKERALALLDKLEDAYLEDNYYGLEWIIEELRTIIKETEQ